jgi:hypothetical protein
MNPQSRSTVLFQGFGQPRKSGSDKWIIGAEMKATESDGKPVHSSRRHVEQLPIKFCKSLNIVADAHNTASLSLLVFGHGHDEVDKGLYLYVIVGNDGDLSEHNDNGQSAINVCLPSPYAQCFWSVCSILGGFSSYPLTQPFPLDLGLAKIESTPLARAPNRRNPNPTS